ncbi:MAG: hypothetical protein MUC56_13900, partial [Thermoanaerobaculales bacterium]|nr:hypothetical protein [Thermoanaerobaculales bacterium]
MTCSASLGPSSTGRTKRSKPTAIPWETLADGLALSPMVAQPCSARTDAMVGRRRIERPTSREPWWWGSRPVSSEATAGVVRGSGVSALANRTPSAA